MKGNKRHIKSISVFKCELHIQIFYFLFKKMRLLFKKIISFCLVVRVVVLESLGCGSWANGYWVFIKLIFFIEFIYYCLSLEFWISSSYVFSSLHKINPYKKIYFLCYNFFSLSYKIFIILLPKNVEPLMKKKLTMIYVKTYIIYYLLYLITTITIKFLVLNKLR